MSDAAPTRDLQRALSARGFNPGPIDGAFGRLTRSALVKFQDAEKLTVNGLPDAPTLAALGLAQRSAAPVWVAEGRRLIGISEIAGPRSNSTIIRWAKAIGGWVAEHYTNDDTPWCGLFVAHCIGSTLPREALPANPLSALAWARFGQPQSKAWLGSILVFRRTGGGHVGFCVGEDKTHYSVLGGNQSNQVSIARVAKSRLVAIRWPVTASSPVAGPVASSSGAISTNER